MKIDKPHDAFIPFVYYHGKEKWDIRKNLTGIINYEDVLKEYISNFEYILNDLSGYTDEEIKGSVIIRM